MKRKFAAAVAAMLIAAVGTTGCLDSGKVKKSEPQPTTAASVEPVTNEDGDEISESMELMRIKFQDVPDIDDGPVIKISDTEAKPGGTAEVTVSVTGADKKWNMCGIHITYPDVLECRLLDEDELTADYELGDASAKNSGFVAMDWQKNLADELVRQKKRSLFFTTLFKENEGRDGDIATFFFKVPDDAQPGTVYKLGYFYMESDMFRNYENDMSFEKYAFEHLKNGSITVR
ncbi:MAG: hypothetical protein K6G33_07215 [Ruminococcus sp.]|uniref:cohesin domain-containing protein n=1 Tax=Ruminococcus sp. TaxID=41978 RepID=UPI0025EFB6B5|nr:cohesin domain-containing protein [Ruminococcus sp.]MCR5600511.1 hypothetical protein [Ruminococcus sp.]